MWGMLRTNAQVLPQRVYLGASQQAIHVFAKGDHGAFVGACLRSVGLLAAASIAFRKIQGCLPLMQGHVTQPPNSL